jgi:hypothetical protein
MGVARDITGPPRTVVEFCLTPASKDGPAARLIWASRYDHIGPAHARSDDLPVRPSCWRSVLQRCARRQIGAVCDRKPSDARHGHAPN